MGGLLNMLLSAGNSAGDIDALMGKIALRNASVVMEAWLGTFGREFGKIVESIARRGRE
jgi:hypothetical protein